jgi:ubiquinol-cytochrome c reductase cytochrome b subunit
VPFIDRYKKFSWKDRPIITAIGITSLAQIIVTTYWGFYIDPDRTKSLLERLVIDPIFLYIVMILLVPLSFGFTYMMIKLAKNAEANAKVAPKKSGQKGSITISPNWLYIIFIALVAFQVYLNISAYYAVLSGMKNYSLFIVGIMMLVFAGMFHLFRHGKSMEKAPPPKPPSPPTPIKSKPTSPELPSDVTKPLDTAAPKQLAPAAQVPKGVGGGTSSSMKTEASLDSNIESNILQGAEKTDSN